MDPMILCDTNVLIEFFKGNSAITQQLELIGRSNLAVSSITVSELYYGAIDKRELLQIVKRLYPIKLLHVTQTTSKIHLELMFDYTLSHNLSLADAMIAATALEHNVQLYTYNRKDFRYIKGLSLYQTQSV